MLAYCLLAALVLGAASAQDHPAVKCANITPLKDVSITTLTGNWVAVESVSFKDGQPFNPPNPADDKRTKTCLYSKDSDNSETGMVVKTDAHYPGKDTVTETSTLTVVGGEHGRLSIQSDIQNRDNWEFMIIDANPSKYLVYVLCQPPNEAGDRFPERVNLMSRHGDHADHEALSHDEIVEVEKSIAQKLGIAGRGVAPVKYSTSCWSSYAESS